jgi:hypothetical protein
MSGNGNKDTTLWEESLLEYLLTFVHKMQIIKKGN